MDAKPRAVRRGLTATGHKELLGAMKMPFINLCVGGCTTVYITHRIVCFTIDLIDVNCNSLELTKTKKKHIEKS